MQHSRPASAAAVRPRPTSAAAFRIEEAEFDMPEIKEALDELRLAQNDVTQSVISTVKESNFSPELVIVVTKIVCTIVGEEVPKDLKSAKAKLGIQGLRSRMISKRTCDVSDPDAIMLAKYIRQLSVLDMPRTPAVMKLVRWISLYVRVVQMLRRTTKKNRKLVAEYSLNPFFQEAASPTSAADNELALGRLAARDLVVPTPQPLSNDPIVVLESYLKSLKSLQSNLNSGAQAGPPTIKIDLEVTSDKEPFTHSPILHNADDTVPIPDDTQMDDPDAWSAALAVPSSTHRLHKNEIRSSTRDSNSAVVELRLREAENTLLKQQLAESEAAIRSAKEQTSSLSLHVDKATEVLKDHETILRNSLRSIVDNAKREAEQIGVQILHSSQSLRSDLVERGSALTNLNSRLECLSSVSSPVQKPHRSKLSQHGFQVADTPHNDESEQKHFELSAGSVGSGGTGPELPSSSSASEVGFEKSHAAQHHSVSPGNLIAKGRQASQTELSLQRQLQESTSSKVVLLQKNDAQELKLQLLSAQLEEQLQLRERRSQQHDTLNHENSESANVSSALISKVRELEEEVGALKQSNKHVTIELEKSIKVAKEFETRSREDEVRYQDASQALTNWKRTAQELGHQVRWWITITILQYIDNVVVQAADLREQYRQLMTQCEVFHRERDIARAECAKLSQLNKDFSQSRENTESALQHAVLRAAASEQQHGAISTEFHQLRAAFESLDARYKETALLLRESDNRHRSLKEEMSRVTERLSQVDSESRMLRERSLSAEAALNAHMAQKEIMSDMRREN
jgi:hypothetical protein